MRKRMIPLLGLLLCGCSETVCEPCQSFSAPTCDEPSSEIAKESVPEESVEESAEQSSSSEEGGWKDDAEMVFIDLADNYQMKFVYQDAFPLFYREISNGMSWGIDIWRPNEYESLARYVGHPYRIYYKEGRER